MKRITAPIIATPVWPIILLKKGSIIINGGNIVKRHGIVKGKMYNDIKYFEYVVKNIG